MWDKFEELSTEQQITMLKNTIIELSGLVYDMDRDLNWLRDDFREIDRRLSNI